jgi:dihydropteroate synthase
LNEFQALGFPLLIGASRKSFIGKALDLEVGERLEGSLAAAAIAVDRGAKMLRVHDVKETVRVVKMAEAIKKMRLKPNNDHMYMAFKLQLKVPACHSNLGIH